MATCPDYVGLACVDGSCPVACADYVAPGIDYCAECYFYEGCTDCALADTEYCSGCKQE